MTENPNLKRCNDQIQGNNEYEKARELKIRQDKPLTVPGEELRKTRNIQPQNNIYFPELQIERPVHGHKMLLAVDCLCAALEEVKTKLHDMRTGRIYLETKLGVEIDHGHIGDNEREQMLKLWDMFTDVMDENEEREEDLKTQETELVKGYKLSDLKMQIVPFDMAPHYKKGDVVLVDAKTGSRLCLYRSIDPTDEYFYNEVNE